MSQESQPHISWFTKLMSLENIFKATVLFVTLFVQGVIVFYNLKSEIHDNKTFDTAEKQVINYRLQNLEARFQQAEAILPKEIKIEPK